ncbi:L-threonine 3-dehydrogenase [Rubeoparvulum massiliense]|uniref:L-threonine 3-dehydrogenase n=1 Tax=Rubeoparvulum massiliense TaxID=1631346 RepID=UPI00164E24E6|nr:L-threonine 3-dehydrogenase [Rubeoparvulum massiliense]
MAELMQAIVKHERGPGARLEKVPIPRIGHDEVLVEVKAASICGTDYHIYTWDAWAERRFGQVPMIFGHEFAGVVVAIGEQVTHVAIGDYVSAETHVVCGRCPQCLQGDFHICKETQILGVDIPGCFAQYVKVPARNIWKNSKTLSFEIASIQEPMGNAVHTTLAGEVVGKSVAVIGCGPIGIMSVPVAQAAGAHQVIAIDINPFRLELAKRLGADHLILSTKENPVERVLELTDGHGVDVVLEMSGHPQAIRQGFQMVTNGGRISMLGIPAQEVVLDIANELVFKGITVQGITGRRMFSTWQQTAALLQSGRVDLTPLITHRLSLERFEEAFTLIKEGKAGKVVLLPNGE